MFVFSSCSHKKVNSSRSDSNSGSIAADLSGSIFSANDSFDRIGEEMLKEDPLLLECSEGKFEEAKNKIFLTAKSDDQYSEMNYRLGACYYIAKNITKAFYFWTKAAAGTKNERIKGNSFFNLSVAHKIKKNSKKALVLAREAYSLRKSPIVIYHLATLELELNLIDALANRYDELQQISSSTDPRWLNLLGDTSLKLSYFDKAESYYSKIPQDNLRKNPIAICNYVVSLYRTSKFIKLTTVLNEYKLELQEESYYKNIIGKFPEILKYDK